MPASYFVVSRETLKTALPMAASFTFSAEMALLVAFLSHLNSSKEQEASISLTIHLFNFFGSVGLAPLYGISLLISKIVGHLRIAEAAGNEEMAADYRIQIRCIYQAALPLAVGLGLMSVAMLSGSSRWVLMTFFRQNSRIAKEVQKNTQLYAIAFLPFALRLASEQVMFSFERTIAAMVLGLSAFVVGMSIAYVLGFGLTGPAALHGSVGVFFGYDVEAFLTAFSFLGFLACALKSFQFFHLGWSNGHTKALRAILSLGKGIAFTNFMEFANPFLCNVFAGLIGAAEQAAFSVIMQYSLFMLLMQWAFAQTTAQFMGRKIGEGNFLEASRYGKCGVLLPPCLLGAIPITVAVRPELLTRKLLHINDPAIARQVALISPWMSIAVIVELIRFSMLQQLRVMKDSNKASMISGIALFLGIGLAGTLAKEKGLLGIAIAYMSTALFTTVVLGVFRWWPRIGARALLELELHPPKTHAGPEPRRWLNRFSWFRKKPEAALQTGHVLSSMDSISDVSPSTPL